MTQILCLLCFIILGACKSKVSEEKSSSSDELALLSASDIKKRANLTIRLSPMTMNHLVARVQILEQIYRAVMIWKGKPYHNE